MGNARLTSRSAKTLPWLPRPAWPPACIVSFVLHALLVLTLGIATGVTAKNAGQSSSEAPSIILRAETTAPDYFSDDDEALAEQTVHIPQQSTPAAGAALAAAFDEAPPIDPSGSLPQAQDWQDVGQAVSGTATTVGDLLNGPRGSTLMTEGQARTSVFGASGVGYKFVYVFDRSGSMGGSGRSALSAAKDELKASLASLGDTHQFQIIFYNDRPTLFPLAGRTGRLVFGNDANKQRAEQFIEGIVADGSTQHEEALNLALRFSPDVIFFLTDADQPALSPGQLERINRRNRGNASINTIEFGLGPQLDSENFLAALARQNGGHHVYFDVTKIDSR